MRSLFLATTAFAAALSAAHAEDRVGGAIKTTETENGVVLTDADGMTLYTFDNDDPGMSNCYDDCAIRWPPLIAEEGAAPEGDYTLVERTDGSMQWAYKGEPLYLWQDDTQPGEMTGDGVGGVWHTARE